MLKAHTHVCWVITRIVELNQHLCGINFHRYTSTRPNSSSLFTFLTGGDDKVNVASNSIASVLKFLQERRQYQHREIVGPREQISYLRLLAGKGEKPPRSTIDLFLTEYLVCTDWFVQNVDQLPELLYLLALFKLEPDRDVTAKVLRMFVSIVEPIILDILKIGRPANSANLAFAVSGLQTYCEKKFVLKFWEDWFTVGEDGVSKWTGQQLLSVVSAIAIAPITLCQAFFDTLCIRVKDTVTARLLDLPDMVALLQSIRLLVYRHDKVVLDESTRTSIVCSFTAGCNIATSNMDNLDAHHLCMFLSALTISVDFVLPSDCSMTLLSGLCKKLSSFATKDLCNAIYFIGQICHKGRVCVDDRAQQQLQYILLGFEREFRSRKSAGLVSSDDVFKAATGCGYLEVILGKNFSSKLDISGAARSIMRQFNPSQLSLYGLRRSFVYAQNRVSLQPSWMVTWVETCEQVMHEFAATDMGRLFQALSLFLARDDQLCKALRLRAAEVDYKNGRQLVGVLHGCTQLRITPPRQLWDILIDKIHTCNDPKDVSTILRAMYSFHLLEPFDDRLLTMLTCSLHERMEKLWSPAKIDYAHLRVLLSCRAVFGDKFVAPAALLKSWLSPSVLQGLRVANSIAHTKTTYFADVKRHIERYIDRDSELAGLVELKETYFLKETGYTVGLLMMPRRAKKPKDGLLIMLMQPNDYYMTKWCVRQPSVQNLFFPKEVMYQLLTKLGYSVLRVPCDEYKQGTISDFLDANLEPYRKQLLT